MDQQSSSQYGRAGCGWLREGRYSERGDIDLDQCGAARPGILIEVEHSAEPHERLVFMSDPPRREAVALFHDASALEAALAALDHAGFGPERVSLLASCDTVEKKLGHRFRKVAELEDNAAAPRVAYVPPEEAARSRNYLIGALSYVAASFGLILASSGGLVPMILAATGAGGTVASVGAALKWLVGHEHARDYEEQLKCGGLLLWIQLKNHGEAELAVEILRHHAGSDLHVRIMTPQV